MKQCTCTPTDLMPFGECICGVEIASRNFQKTYTEKEVIALFEEFLESCEEGSDSNWWYGYMFEEFSKKKFSNNP